MGGLAELKGKRVLVTGASGFVGQHVLTQGLELGIDLHAVSRTERKPSIVRWWQGDLLDAGAVNHIVSEVKPDGILHLAAGGVAYGAGSNQDVLRVNIEGTAVLLDAVRAARIEPHVVLAGSGFEYAPSDHPLREDDPIAPTTVYGVSKAAATRLAGLFAGSFPVTVLRLFSLFGPGEREPRIVPYVIGQARRNSPAELTPGAQVRDYTYVKDAAAGFWQALSVVPQGPEPRVLNLASGVVVTLRALVELLALLMQKRGISPDLRFGARGYRSGELMTYSADISSLRSALAWWPTTPLAAGLAEVLDQGGPQEPSQVPYG